TQTPPERRQERRVPRRAGTDRPADTGLERGGSMPRRKRSLGAAVLVTAALACVASVAAFAGARAKPDSATTTPIKHLVVIFQENVSFDHYFGTYPHAANPARDTGFTAAADTPSVNGLNDGLLSNNPNLANPARLDPNTPGNVVTCDQDHGYTDEQKAFDNGLMDKFVQTLAGSSCTDKSIVMDYYDGNTVTALWNYAQHFALNDNSFGTGFGPSTPGAVNLTSGQTHGATPATVPGNVANGTVIGDPRPLLDDCSPATGTKIQMSGTNVGDLLNAKSLTWGWFQGGFRPSSTVN